MSDAAVHTAHGLSAMPETGWIFIAKALGASAGSAVSIAYMVPRGRREAVLRLVIGMITGMVFGTTVGWKLADYFSVADRISSFEVALSGAALASLCAWWGLGALVRIVGRIGR